MSEALLVSVGKGIASVRVKKKGNQKWDQNRDICIVFFDINCRRESERLLTVTLKFVCGWYRKTDCH